MDDLTKELVLDAIAANSLDFVLGDPRFNRDPEVLTAAVDKNWELLKYVDAETRDVAVAAVRKRGGKMLEFVNDDLQNDRDLVLTAINQDGWGLRYAGATLKKEMVLAAI